MAREDATPRQQFDILKLQIGSEKTIIKRKKKRHDIGREKGDFFCAKRPK